MNTVLDTRQRERPSRRRGKHLFVIVPALILVLLLMWGPTLTREVGLYIAQYTSNLYAFYLDNGNVFYGKVRGVGFDRITLVDAYTFQTVSVGETSTNNLILQQDNPITRPENWLMLERSHVLYFEQIGEEATLRKAIQQ